jgi:demethylmenaquinone methyltransferase/2-methoxy-6-polyprenyl-1,4-benzoquinol methylase
MNNLLFLDMPKEKSLLSTHINYDHLSRLYDLFSSGEWRLTEAGLHLVNIQPGEKVLEIGFGTSHEPIQLARAIGKSRYVSGIDLSHRPLLECAEFEFA